jgi:hypothetical protein
LLANYQRRTTGNHKTVHSEAGTSRIINRAIHPHPNLTVMDGDG